MSFVIAVNSSVDLRTFSQKRVVRVSLKNKNHEKRTSSEMQITTIAGNQCFNVFNQPKNTCSNFKIKPLCWYDEVWNKCIQSYNKNTATTFTDVLVVPLLLTWNTSGTTFIKLTHLWPVFPFYNPWKHQKKRVFQGMKCLIFCNLVFFLIVLNTYLPYEKKSFVPTNKFRFDFFFMQHCNALKM